MKRSTILQSGRMLLALLLLAWASTNGWGQSEVLKSGNFNEGLSFYSYEQDKKISLGEDTWFISTSQYDNTNFFLGCNKEEMGLLSDSWDDVVTAIKTVKPDFRKNKEHAYAMRLQLGGSVLEGVNHIQFDWGYASANSSLDVYVFVDSGSGLEMAGQAELGDIGEPHQRGILGRDACGDDGHEPFKPAAEDKGPDRHDTDRLHTADTPEDRRTASEERRAQD